MFAPTQEQRSILNAFSEGKNLKIHAFAGTGKTSTLCYLANSTDREGLYFAFNKRLATEAKKMMPRNVMSGTVHSFAHKWASSEFPAEKLFKNTTQNLIEREIAIPPIKHFSVYKTVRTILLTITSFCQSNNVDVGPEHLPWDHEAYVDDQEILKRNETQLVDAASCAWCVMSRSDTELPLGHDGYLKLWSLSQPELSFDFLFVDEAQDLSPVMLQILENFQGQKVIVGDSQQQIYSWRGATNAMAHDFIADDHYLTKTFRFGDKLADIANNVLKSLSVEKQIVSANGSGTEVTTEPASSPDAFLFRKNVTLIQSAVNNFRSGQDFHIVDPNKNIALTVDDYFRLNDGLWGKSQTFEGFNSWDRVVQIAKSEADTPFTGYVDLFENNDPLEIKNAVAAPKKKAGNSYPSLSTIHQAKGLEWPVVQLADDFKLDYKAQNHPEKEEELRLLYVALTRAEHKLSLPDELLFFCQSILGQKRQRFAVLDLETTGLSPEQGDRITEVGIVMMENDQIIDRFQSLVNPNRHIPSDVQKLTGITDDMVANAPNSKKVFLKAMAFIGDTPLVAHNASFERKFLNNELQEISPDNEVNLLCTMLLSRRIFPDLDCYNLGSLVSRFHLPIGQAHRALSDAEMTAHLLMRLKKQIILYSANEFEFNPDNILRILKSQPKAFREQGLTEGIASSLSRNKRFSYPSHKFSYPSRLKSKRTESSYVPAPTPSPPCKTTTHLSVKSEVKDPVQQLTDTLTLLRVEIADMKNRQITEKQLKHLQAALEKTALNVEQVADHAQANAEHLTQQMGQISRNIQDTNNKATQSLTEARKAIQGKAPPPQAPPRLKSAPSASCSYSQPSWGHFGLFLGALLAVRVGDYKLAKEFGESILGSEAEWYCKQVATLPPANP